MNEGITVDLVVRSDALRKSGGDTIQAEAYSAELEALGVDTRVVPFSLDLRPRAGAIVHHLNVDRVHDFLAVAAAASEHPLVVTPIHHPAAAVRALRHTQRSLSLSGMTAFLPESAREFVAFGRRAVVDGTRLTDVMRTGTRLVGTRQRIGRALDGAARVTLLTEDEGDALRADFGWQGRNGVVIPNGAPTSSAFAARTVGIEEPILVVGRIEPRKRQLEVAAAAAAAGVRVGFIGAANPNDATYTERFRALVSRNPHLTWHGHLPHGETVSAIAGARVVVSFGWAEVQSLVEIEAAQAGCFVVHNSDTGSRSWLGSRAVGHPSSDLDGAVRTAARLAEGDGGGDWQWPHTWQDAGQRLLSVYRAALALPSIPASA